MSDTYRIETLGGFSRYEEGGTKGDYLVTVQGDDREFKLFHDSSSDFDAPSVGDDLYGEIKKDKRNQWRISRKPKPKAGGKGGGGYSPEEVARITRSHSQEMALRYFSLRQSEGKLPKDFNLGHVRDCAAWFDRDVQAAVPPAPSNGSAPQVQQQEVPADTEGLVPDEVAAAVAASKSGDDIPF